MVGLPATSEIPAIDVCAFILFYDEKKIEASSIYTSIYHSGKRLLRSFPFGIYSLLFSLSFFRFFIQSFSSFFLLFLSSFLHSLSLSVFTKRIVVFHSLLQATQKLKYPNTVLSVVLKKVSSSSDHTKQKLFAK